MLGLGSFAVLVASDRPGVVPAPIHPLPYCVRRSNYCEGFIETCKRLSGLQKGNGMDQRRICVRCPDAKGVSVYSPDRPGPMTNPNVLNRTSIPADRSLTA